ncbi:hypothetical protein RhiirA5_410390 [Rhizophagus irregularis]|uniref:Uncharacterized protein n=2 Tax=Rhizophagus irregularis TaxID=588596 RepID=A0A2I1DTN7_9GLOM|nr:hypothetical protein RhiirA5_410390 [Rhizophagus irregularis]PKY13242.1 hypothetical protein RhiirB3_425021 [Rhizophagus irregularis]
MVGKDIATQTLTILNKNKFISPSEEIIATIESIILVELHFDSGDTTADNIQHLDSIVRACDETLISRNGYQKLAQAVPNLIREHAITLIMKALVPIKTLILIFLLLMVMMMKISKILLKLNLMMMKITFGDKINIKLSGDGRNVGHKQKYVMLIMCILNEGEAVLNPSHQYSICLYIEKESYNSLSTVSAKFLHELKQLLKEASDGTIWPIELFFSGDWKFVALILGINAAMSNYFCLMQKSYAFCEINQNNWIPDELHLMLQISDVLFQCLFYELVKQKEFINKTQALIIEEMKKLHDFQVANLFEGQEATRGQNIEKIWREFYRLYKIMHQKSITNEEINQFEVDAKQWIHDFCRPIIGTVNSANQQQGMYLRTEVRLFFGGTTMGGRKSKRPVIHDIFYYENYYQIHDTPIKYTRKSLEIKT